MARFAFGFFTAWFLVGLIGTAFFTGAGAFSDTVTGLYTVIAMVSGALAVWAWVEGS